MGEKQIAPKVFSLCVGDGSDVCGNDAKRTTFGFHRCTHKMNASLLSTVQVVIQPSSRRAYTMREYEKAGATISDDLSEADTVVGGSRNVYTIYVNFSRPV